MLNHHRWTEPEDIILLENYLKLEKEKLMILLPYRSWNGIKVRFHKIGCGDRRKNGLAFRKYSFDFSYFNVIDTQEKAYWLGFIYADGHINSRGNFTMSLVVEGQKHLKKFADTINYNGKVMEEKRLTSAGNKVYSLCLNHTKFAKDLMLRGVIPRKTWLVKFPKKFRQNNDPTFYSWAI